jgi:hypothetical protein
VQGNDGYLYLLDQQTRYIWKKVQIGDFHAFSKEIDSENRCDFQELISTKIGQKWPIFLRKNPRIFSVCFQLIF